jgi:uroporphyrinogen III methyltransferase/synthase
VDESSFVSAIAEADIVSFTSASSVRNFGELLRKARRAGGDEILPPPAAAIGPIAAGAARELGFEVLIEAVEHTIPGLVSALCDYFGSGKET